MRQWPAWLEGLVGVPFADRGRGRAGADCWGIVRLALQAGFSIEVPDYTEGYRTATDEREVAALLRNEALGWHEIPVSRARLGDVIVLRVQGLPTHCGLVIEAPWFLHGFKGRNSCVEQWESPTWRQRVVGLYRHPALCGVEVGAS